MDAATPQTASESLISVLHVMPMIVATEETAA